MKKINKLIIILCCLFGSFLIGHQSVMAQCSALFLSSVTTGAGATDQCDPADPLSEEFTITYATCPGSGEPDPLDISGLTIFDNTGTGNPRYVFPAGSMIASGASLTVAAGDPGMTCPVWNNGNDCLLFGTTAPASVDVALSVIYGGSTDPDCTGAPNTINATSQGGGVFTLSTANALDCSTCALPCPATPPTIPPATTLMGANISCGDPAPSISAMDDGPCPNTTNPIVSFSATSTSAQLYDKPNASNDCSGTQSSVVNHPYVTMDFSVPYDGVYDIESDDGTLDGVIYLYDGAFDPNNATGAGSNCLDADDDGGAGSLIENVALTKNTCYTLVMTSFNGNSANTTTFDVEVRLDVSNNTTKQVVWYDDMTAGTTQGTGTSLNVAGTDAEEGTFDVNTPGTYTYYAACSCLGMESTRQAVSVTVVANCCDISLDDVAVMNETCAGDMDGSITITASSSNTIQYSIDGGTTLVGSGSFTGLAPGVYDIYVQDMGDASCNATQQVTIAAGSSITAPTVGASPSIACGDAIPTLTATCAADDCGTPASAEQTLSFEDNNDFVEIDGNGTTFTTAGTITVPAGAFPAGYVVTDINVTVEYDKTDGTCASPATGSSFLGEFGLGIQAPDGTVVTFITQGDYGGNTNITPGVTQIFDDEAGGPPPTGGVPMNGTFQPASGMLSGLNGSLVAGTWNVLGNDDTNFDPLCILNASIEITAQMPATTSAATVTWYNAASGGTALATGSPFDPTGTMAEEGAFDNNTEGTYTYYVACECPDGCTSTLEAMTVTVGTCIVPEITNNSDPTGVDPCSCNNDQSANGAQDGTFSETVTVTSGIGETWMVTAITFATGGSVAPNSIAVNDMLTDNGDGTYEITFNHTDLSGYQITVSNGTDDLMFSNVCTYPVITAATLSNYCNAPTADPVVPLNVTETTGVFTGVTQLFGTGTNGTAFDPATAPHGSHTITATYTPFPGTGIGGTVAAPAIPNNSCPVSISQIVDVINCTPQTTCDCSSDSPLSIVTNAITGTGDGMTSIYVLVDNDNGNTVLESSQSGVFMAVDDNTNYTVYHLNVADADVAALTAALPATIMAGDPILTGAAPFDGFCYDGTCTPAPYNVDCMCFECPQITSAINTGDICPGSTFDLTATYVDDALLAQTTGGGAFDIDFVLYPTATTNPYDGTGTTLGTATSAGGTATLTGMGASLTSGTYFIYAILSGTPTDASCRPSAVTEVTIYDPLAITAVPTCTGSAADNEFFIEITAISGGSGDYTIAGGAVSQTITGPTTIGPFTYTDQNAKVNLTLTDNNDASCMINYDVLQLTCAPQTACDCSLAPNPFSITAQAAGNGNGYSMFYVLVDNTDGFVDAVNTTGMFTGLADQTNYTVHAVNVLATELAAAQASITLGVAFDQAALEAAFCADASCSAMFEEDCGCCQPNAGTQSTSSCTSVCADGDDMLASDGSTVTVDIDFGSDLPTATQYGYGFLVTDASGTILIAQTATNFSSASPANFSEDILLNDGTDMLMPGDYCIHGFNYLLNSVDATFGFDPTTIGDLVGETVDASGFDPATLYENDGTVTTTGMNGTNALCADLNIDGCTPVTVLDPIDITANPTCQINPGEWYVEITAVTGGFGAGVSDNYTIQASLGTEIYTAPFTGSTIQLGPFTSGGNVAITATDDNAVNLPCPDCIGTAMVTGNPSAITEAGNPIGICQTKTVTLADLGASFMYNGTDAVTGVWSTSGDGAFDNTAFGTGTIYTPGPNDIANGSVTLTLSSDTEATGPCPDVSDDVIIMIQPVDCGTFPWNGN